MKNPKLILEGVELTEKKCNNKHICNIFQKLNKISPRGIFFVILKLRILTGEELG